MKVNNKDLKQQKEYHQGQKKKLCSSTFYLAQNNEERHTSILDIHQSMPYQLRNKTYQPST